MAAQRPEAEQGVPESEALTRELDELEVQLAELKAHYEQYFLGVDRHPPTKADADVRQRLARLRGGQTRNAVLKFRVQALQQRFTTFDRLWKRTLSEMENGTYQRDLFRARRRRKTGEAPLATPKVESSPVETTASTARPTQNEGPKAPLAPVPTGTQGGAVRPGPVPAVAPVAIPQGTQGGAVRPGPVPAVAPVAIPQGTQGGVGRPAPLTIPLETQGGVVRRAPRAIPQGTQGGAARAAAEALAEPRLRAVYAAYLAAKQSCQEDVSRLSFEAVADSLRKQVPELLQRHGARDVEYKVVVKDGKAVLRAVPKG